MTVATLTGKRRQILEFIAEHIQRNGYPPSVREIGEAVGLSSSSTVHTHLQLLQREGFLRRDPTKPRTLSVSFEPISGAAISTRPVANVPLLGSVAAGTGVLAEENIEEVLPIAEDLTGPGQLFMLRVRGDSMIGAGIFDGDLVVVRSQPEANEGEIVVAGINDEEATVKTYRRQGAKVILVPSNPDFEPMSLDANEVTIYGKVVTVLRRL
ncbi:MAG TPA: transcriptional repressor LexA [Acidimicrobiales bacterium]|nr:transcriptional repressor LexA [Acidimicrobiales bacterium]